MALLWEQKLCLQTAARRLFGGGEVTLDTFSLKPDIVSEHAQSPRSWGRETNLAQCSQRFTLGTTPITSSSLIREGKIRGRSNTFTTAPGLPVVQGGGGGFSPLFTPPSHLHWANPEKQTPFFSWKAAEGSLITMQEGAGRWCVRVWGWEWCSHTLASPYLCPH